MGHQNREAMAHVGVRVDLTVTLRRGVEGFRYEHCLIFHGRCSSDANPRCETTLVTDATADGLLISFVACLSQYQPKDASFTGYPTVCLGCSYLSVDPGQQQMQQSRCTQGPSL